VGNTREYLSWRWWPADMILGFMLSGLLAGPLFAWLDGPLFGPIGQFILWLGLGICPEPLTRFPTVGHMEIVCTRCIAAIGGLVVVRWLYARPQRLNRWWARWSWPKRLLATLPILALWQLDIHALYAGWWDSAPGVQSVSGVLVGLAIGLLVYPVLVWLSHRGAVRAGQVARS
jgi:uncharacterized membrane protein